MAAGIPKGPVHCKRCNTEYSSFSELRKHQWAEHKGLYKSKQKKGWSKKQRAKFEATIAAKNGSTVRGFLNGAAKVKNITSANEMSARDVLDELRKQRDFMNDIVDMVEGMIK